MSSTSEQSAALLTDLHPITSRTRRIPCTREPPSPGPFRHTTRSNQPANSDDPLPSPVAFPSTFRRRHLSRHQQHSRKDGCYLRRETTFPPRGEGVRPSPPHVEQARSVGIPPCPRPPEMQCSETVTSQPAAGAHPIVLCVACHLVSSRPIRRSSDKNLFSRFCQSEARADVC
jgi:hypothetical protein